MTNKGFQNNHTRWIHIREMNAAFGNGRQLARQEFAARLSRARMVYLRRSDARWNWIALCFCLAVVCGVMMPISGARASATGAHGDIHSGTLLVTDGDTGARVPVPRLATDVAIQVSGLISRVNVEQRFRNNRAEWLEGVYMLPLPDDAAVDTLEITIGGRVIVGEIREKGEARKVYQAAKQTGKRTGLVESKRPNLFSVSVANIAPGEDVRVRIAYLQTLRYDQGSYSLRFPLTLTPRYAPAAQDSGVSDTGGPGVTIPAQLPSLPATAIRYAAFRDAAPGDETVSIQATIDAGVALDVIESPFHDIVVVGQAGYSGSTTVYEVTLADSQVRPDCDFELSWTPAPGAQPGVSIFTEQYNGDTYVLFMFMPPDEQYEINQPRELVFVIDTSGSMGGASIRQAKVALHMALDWLGPDDRFNVIEFNSVTRSLFLQPDTASKTNIRQAHHFVDVLQANGGTEMAPALRVAFSNPPTDGFLRQVVFVTDGSVGNEAQLFRMVADHLADSRLFTVGIGAAPNDYFMRKAAQFGRGTYTFIGSQAQVGTRMESLFSKLRKPVLTDINIQWPDASALKTWPEKVPDLYAGEPVVVAAKLDKPQSQLLVSGKSGTGYWSRQPAMVSGRSHAGVATMWARRQIDALFDQQFMGADAGLVRKAVLDLALEHRIVSRYTSLVAVDKTPVRPMNASSNTQRFANLKPAGTARAIGMPATATSSRLNLWLGIALLLAALLVEATMRLLSRCRQTGARA